MAQYSIWFELRSCGAPPAQTTTFGFGAFGSYTGRGDAAVPTFAARTLPPTRASARFNYRTVLCSLILLWTLLLFTILFRQRHEVTQRVFYAGGCSRLAPCFLPAYARLLLLMPTASRLTGVPHRTATLLVVAVSAPAFLLVRFSGPTIVPHFVPVPWHYFPLRWLTRAPFRATCTPTLPTTTPAPPHIPAVPATVLPTATSQPLPCMPDVCFVPLPSPVLPFLAAARGDLRVTRGRACAVVVPTTARPFPHHHNISPLSLSLLHSTYRAAAWTGYRVCAALCVLTRAYHLHCAATVACDVMVGLDGWFRCLAYRTSRIGDSGTSCALLGCVLMGGKT